MSLRAPRRHALLLLVILLVPCVGLIALGVRMIAEGDDIALARQAEADRRHREQVGDELLARLERTKLEQVSRQAAMGPDGGIAPAVHPDIAIVGRVSDGQLQFPWDVDPARSRFTAMLAGGRVADLLRQGEREEARLQFEQALSTLERAVAAAPDRISRDYANLLWSRVLIKCRCDEQAAGIVEELLDSPVADDQSVPLAFYAAKLMLRLPGHEARVLAAIAARPMEPWAGPTAADFRADLLREIAAAASDADDKARATALLESLAAPLAELERALRLQGDWIPMGSGAGDRDAAPRWLPYDDGAWLVSVAPSPADRPGLLVAVRAKPVLAAFAAAAPGTSALKFSTHTPLGQPVGPAFPGLTVSMAEAGVDSALASWSAQRTYYIVALLAVMGVALAGGLVFWWDVRRELRAAELRAQFVASVSHELRTPLTAIRMFAETLLLERPLGSDERREYLDTIVSESERLTRLVGNVLDYSRIERGDKVYHPAPASLASIVRDAARTMRYPLARHGFELSVDLDEAVPPVMVDRDAIEQAVLNLLGNAMKYSGNARAIALTVARANGHGVVAVRDQGVGIAEAEQARIFDRFYRAPTTENDRIPGTGLGLALVDHIVRAHGGRVEVQSAPGAGSTFALHLPLAHEGESAATS
jgi:two-component system phosphate regulon sensor histidine kinase PhoR